jgi:hypothetical protein
MCILTGLSITCAYHGTVDIPSSHLPIPFAHTSIFLFFVSAGHVCHHERCPHAENGLTTRWALVFGPCILIFGTSLFHLVYTHGHSLPHQPPHRNQQSHLVFGTLLLQIPQSSGTVPLDQVLMHWVALMGLFLQCCIGMRVAHIDKPHMTTKAHLKYSELQPTTLLTVHPLSSSDSYIHTYFAQVLVATSATSPQSAVTLGLRDTAHSDPPIFWNSTLGPSANALGLLDVLVFLMLYGYGEWE